MEGREGYDGVTGGFFIKEGGHSRPRVRWNKFKWALLIANSCTSPSHPCRCPSRSLTRCPGPASSFRMVTDWPHFLSLLGLMSSNLLTSFASGTASNSSSRRFQLRSLLARCWLAAVTSVIGWAGILLNNRSFLAIYNFLFWISLAFLVTSPTKNASLISKARSTLSGLAPSVAYTFNIVMYNFPKLGLVHSLPVEGTRVDEYRHPNVRWY